MDKRKYNFHGNDYLVDEYGVVYGIKGLPLKQIENKDGYLEVFLRGKEVNKYGNIVRYKVKVHAIVAKSFIPIPDDDNVYEVNHKDCNRKNNKKSNLEWLTHYDNIQYSIKYGNHKSIKSVGEDNNKSKLKETDVLNIRKLFDNGLSIREIYKKYYQGIISENSIGNICKRRTWNHI